MQLTASVRVKQVELILKLAFMSKSYLLIQSPQVTGFHSFFFSIWELYEQVNTCLNLCYNKMQAYCILYIYV